MALPIVQSITADDATADLDPEAVMQLLGSFQERVQQAIALEERIHPTVLHAWLKEAITSVMDPSPLSPSWQFAPTALVARGRSPGRNKGKGKGDQQRGPTAIEPEFYRISDPLGTDAFLGSRDQELEADYQEATLLESLNSIRDPFPGDSSDDGAPGSYNVEELDEALERQAAADAQRELDEAFERARHNLNEDVQPDSITVLESGSAPRNKLQVRHVPGRDLTQLGYQARQRVNVPAVPHWHGPTAQDRDAIGRAQVDAWRRQRDAILEEGYERRRQLMAQAMEAEYEAAATRGRNPAGSSSSSSQNQNILNPTPKTYPKGGKGLGLADDGFPWDHYARPISGEGRDSAPLRPNRFTGRPSSSTAPPERSDAAPPGRSIGTGKGIEPKPRWIRRGKGKGTLPSTDSALVPGVQQPEAPEVSEEPLRSSQPKQGPKGEME